LAEICHFLNIKDGDSSHYLGLSDEHPLSAFHLRQFSTKLQEKFDENQTISDKLVTQLRYSRKKDVIYQLLNIRWELAFP
jgi:hypothetical protein